MHSYLKYKALVNNKSIDGGDTRIESFPFDVEGVEVKYFNSRVGIPVYANADVGSGGFSIPIGGGSISEDEEHLFSSFQKKGGTSVVITSTSSVKVETCNDFRSTNFLNKMKHVDEVLRKYSLDEKQFKITLPLVAYHYDFKKPVYKVANQNLCIIGCGHNSVAERFVYRTRMPLSFTVGTLFAFAAIGKCAVLYFL